ncbi:MAG: glucuronate isomerase [Clostridiales bacterium]|nr:glucuronate isomerase [Clostridiales bacterium]
MKAFMGEDFLLPSKTAQRLYGEYAERLPIVDYHNHLSAKEIYEDNPAENIARLWFGADHYKWRLMRANGVPERLIMGDAPDYDKFAAYAATLSYAAGNPLYHWSHLELRRYFGIDTPLSGETAADVWARANERIRQGGFSPRALLRRANVTALCTTEDPADDLSWHLKLRDEPDFSVKVLPAFRPEKAGELWRGKDWKDYLGALSARSGVEVSSFASLRRALLVRMGAFDGAGCVASDFGVERFPFAPAGEQEIEAIFARALSLREMTREDVDKYLTALLSWLAGEYKRLGWVMELHIGPVRARNTRMTARCGRDAGFDSVSDHPVAEPLGAFLDMLDGRNELPKTILFGLNHRDTLALLSTAGDFQNESYPTNVQVGAAWWINDHRDGMIEQMRLLASQGLLGRFLGMTTDSRSFLSFARHEYFRRVACGLVGGWVEDGEYPDDPALLKRLVEDLCGGNATRYFGF